jgi:hypothetical protein
MNTYFEDGSGEIFGWGTSYLEGSAEIGTGTAQTLALTLHVSGLEGLCIGFRFDW